MTYRIKPLKWGVQHKGRWAEADTWPGAYYLVALNATSEKWEAMFEPKGRDIGDHPTQEAAMAACQRDWESTLKEYLEEA